MTNTDWFIVGFNLGIYSCLFLSVWDVTRYKKEKN